MSTFVPFASATEASNYQSKRLQSSTMKLLLALTALVAVAAAANAQVLLGTVDNSCQFASFSPAVVPISPDTHRATGLDNTTPVKFLFANQMCSDFTLCVSDAALSGGDGCAVQGAKSSATSACTMRGTARGDGTYELSLADPSCQGLDLVNCLSVNADGTAMEITQSCQAKIESLTISCTACAAPMGAVAKSLQVKPACSKYGYCGKCDCPPPPPPPIAPICSAKCAGKSSCTCDDKTYVQKDDRTGCQVLDSTTCTADNNVKCEAFATVTNQTDVDCPKFRARVELVFEKQLPTGNWVRVNAPGTTEYETPVNTVKCPDPIVNLEGSGRRVGAKQDVGQAQVTCGCKQTGSCVPQKSGTCGAQKTGFCACTKLGGCVPRPGPFEGKIEVCPEEGGTEFPPCNGWDCGKHPMPYPPKGGSPKGGAYPPKGGMYPPKDGGSHDFGGKPPKYP
ncbi:hypothetical protein OEZ86_012640 [Tetradesmus obliquus]|nr:hypothetical protein OEZ86_012640 [Tetradesmus obliquus]